MNTREFEERFDVLYNNIASNAAPGIDAYEKSVLLTKAEYEILKNYINKLGNKYGQGADDSSIRQIDLKNVTEFVTLASASGTPYDLRGKLFSLPDNKSIFSILNESVSFTKNGRTVMKQVIPLSFSEYTRLMQKPYKEPLKSQVWRLITNNQTVEIIPSSEDKNFQLTYKLRFIRKPKPIILTNLTSYGLTIEGESDVTECELDPSIHEEILQRAVELAKASYASDQSGQAQLQNQITIGKRSE